MEVEQYTNIEVSYMLSIDMKFFTAGDVLQQQTEVDLENPVTINLEDTIYDALCVMFTNDFS